MSKRRHGFVRLGLVLSVSVAPFMIQCGGSGSSGTNCPVGSEGCRCTPGGTCDPGLTCLSNYCVDRTSGNEGGAGMGDAGAPGAGGSGTEGGSPGAGGGSPGAGGARTEGGAPGTGGSDTEGGAPGSGGATAQGGAAGVVASAGTAGTPSSAGAGGQAGPGGAGGAAGSAGSAGGPIELEPCAGSDDCESGDICVYDVDGNGSCITGSQQPCDTDLTCINDMGFVPVTGIEGDFCEVGGDCQVDDGHVVGICVDKAGDGSDHGCVAICQYAGDPSEFGCATHPQIGIWEECSRTNVRAFLAAAKQVYCVGDSLQSIVCQSVAPADSVSADFEWTIACTEQATSCTAAANCFTNSPYAADPEATQNTSQFFDAISASGTSYVYTESGSSGLGGDCTTDCDCGRCNYCEGGECRYGGEGPYGCYRGCS
jgi:hypothetical protein